MPEPQNPYDPPGPEVPRSDAPTVPAARRNVFRQVLFILLGVAVTVGSLWWSLKDTNLDDLKAGAANANYLTLPVMLGLLFGFYWLKVLRWKWMLAPVAQLTSRQLFPPMLIGFAANNLLPAHLGEFIRVWVVRKKYGVPTSAVLSTVVLERIFDVLAILAWFGVGLMYSEGLPEDYQRAVLVLAGLAAVMVVAVVVYLIWTQWFLGLLARVFGWFPFLPSRLTAGVLNMLRQGADGLGSLRSGRAVMLILASSLAQWLLNGMIAYVALRAFRIDVTPATGLIVTGITAFGVTIPSTPGYFGVIQLCFQTSMNMQSIKTDPSLVFGASIYYQLSMYIPVTLLGVYYLRQSGLSLKDLKRASAESDVTIAARS